MGVVSTQQPASSQQHRKATWLISWKLCVKWHSVSVHVIVMFLCSNWRTAERVFMKCEGLFYLILLTRYDKTCTHLKRCSLFRAELVENKTGNIHISVTLRHFRVRVVDVQKQRVLHILSVSVALVSAWTYYIVI